jgi:hypothetical protein
MLDALSVMPTVLICVKKNFTTSNNGIPRNPGRDVTLLLPTICLAGGEDAIDFFILAKMGIGNWILPQG